MNMNIKKKNSNRQIGSFFVYNAAVNMHVLMLIFFIAVVHLIVNFHPMHDIQVHFFL